MFLYSTKHRRKMTDAGRVKTLEAQLKQAQDDVTRYKGLYTEKDNELFALRKEKDELTESLASAEVKEENASLEKENRVLYADRKKLQGELDEERSKYTQLAGEKQELQKQYDEHVSQQLSLRQHERHLQSENEKLERQLTTAMQERNKLRVELEQAGGRARAAASAAAAGGAGGGGAAGGGGDPPPPSRLSGGAFIEPQRRDASSLAGLIARRGGNGGGGDPGADPPDDGNGALGQANDRRRNDEGRINANQLMLIREYKGEESEDIEMWVTQVNSTRMTFGWTDAQTASMAQTRLIEKAACWLRSALKTEGPMQNLGIWKTNVRLGVTGLEKALLDRFRENINERGAVEAVIDLRQKASESVTEFYDRVVNAMDRKNYLQEDKEDPVYREALRSETYTFFAAGLHQEIRLQAMGGPTPPHTAEGLLTAARNAETERRRNKLPKAIAEVEVAAAEEQPPTEELTLEAVNAKVEKFTKGRGGKSAGGSTPKCFFCGQPGHFVVNCPRRRPAPAPAFYAAGRRRALPAPAATTAATYNSGRGRGRGGAGRGRFARDPRVAEFVAEVLEQLNPVLEPIGVMEDSQWPSEWPFEEITDDGDATEEHQEEN